MRRLSFIITILGLSILLLSLNIKPLSFSQSADLNKLPQNQKLIIQDKVIKETYTRNSKLLYLSNNLSLQCDLSCPSYLNQNISAQVILEKYNNNNYLKILKIKLT